ncbi:MAG: DUF3048 domain-containing protein [bacterium]|nr:DUF3048 domain-containing protein [bacterium]
MSSLILKNKFLLMGVGIILAVVVAFFAFGGERVISISGGGEKVQLAGIYPISALSGIECQNADRRPVAVMLASDPETRPLSGVGRADIVFEMPVTPDGITRIMAVYQCELPDEIGSIRSSRLDFVPLAKGLNAIYAHWGGEREALKELNAGVIDNIDGLKYENIYYFRKPDRPRPHNGFTSEDLIEKAIAKLGYNNTNTFSGYTHAASRDRGSISPPEIFNSDFSGKVKWEYEPVSNLYLRSRNGRPEIDKNTGKQVEAANVVIMETTSSPIDKDYIRVKTLGSGRAVIYQNGLAVSGKWVKEKDSDRLLFSDDGGREVPFTPGMIWIEITIN